MIDVVFQLLIYFLLGTSFAVGEQTFRMDLPDRSGPSEVDPFELDDAPVVVEVLGENYLIKYKRQNQPTEVWVHVSSDLIGPKGLMQKYYEFDKQFYT